MVEAGAGDAVVCESDDDEVIDLPLAPQGSAILLPPPTPDGAACRGIVVALDEPGMRMLVTIDETLEERWVGATEGWELEELEELRQLQMLERQETHAENAPHEQMREQPHSSDSPHSMSRSGAGADSAGADSLAEGPILHRWKWNADGSLTGHIWGKEG